MQIFATLRQAAPQLTSDVKSFSHERTSMEHETIVLKNGNIDVWKNDNLIYCKVNGEYTDDDVLLLIKYLENGSAK